MDSWVRPTRVCRGPCGRTLPLTKEHWYRRRRSPDGFQARCIPCTRQALDQADAKRKAEPRQYRPATPVKPAASPPAADEYGRLVALVRAHAADVVDVLLQATETGDPLIPALLVEELCATCPLQQVDDEGHPDCTFHVLAAAHADALAQRYPHTRSAVQAYYTAPDAPTAAGERG